MNNLFYEFLEKNHLQGLEDNLSTLDVFNEAAGALSQIIPKNDNYEIIAAEYMSCVITHNKKRYTLYMRGGGRTFFIMPRGAVTINAEQEKAIAEILNLLKTKAGIADFKIIPAKTITIGKNSITSPIYTFKKGATDFKAFYKIIRNFIIKQKPGVSTDSLNRGQNKGSMNASASSNNVSSNNASSSSASNSSTTVSSNATGSVTAPENKRGNGNMNRNPYQEAIKQKVITAFIQNIKTAGSLMPANAKLKENKGLFKSSMITKEIMKMANPGKEKEINAAVDNIKVQQTLIRNALITAGYTGDKIINQFLADHKKAVVADEPAIKWFYENHVNKHFTLKRIFNS
jgi:hypothetical protein